jgi:hypothetical protein
LKWHRIRKEISVQPSRGTYHNWKDKVAEECYHHCTYCAIPEERFGGIRNFHVDHHRPKAIFDKLENDIKNLFLACSICNGFKSDDWPNEPAKDHSRPAYPCPSKVDYTDLFDCLKTGEINGLYIAAKYVVERLFLNRPQLILERREYLARNRFRDLNKSTSNIENKITKMKSKDQNYYYRNISTIRQNLLLVISELDESLRYSSGDVTRKR